jgi:hypothetical protein
MYRRAATIPLNGRGARARGKAIASEPATTIHAKGGINSEPALIKNRSFNDNGK